MRYKQLLSFIMFLIVEIYVFSTIAFSLLGKDFMHENEGNQENACGSLLYCFLSHLEFGLRTDGGIGEYTAKLSFMDDPGYFMGMFFFQFTFYIITIVIMYLLRNSRRKAFGWGCGLLTLMSPLEAFAFLMMIPISKYNGERGKKMNKYFFYAFYPVHIGLIYLLTLLVGFTTFSLGL